MSDANAPRGRIRLLIADDHELVLDGLKSRLQAHQDLEVVAVVVNGDELIRAYEEHRPDVVLTDDRMKPTGGILATARILELDPDAKVLFLSALHDTSNIKRALDAGAVGYLSKRTPSRDLADHVRSAAAGCKEIFDSVASEHIPPDATEVQETPSLTTREITILRLVDRGLRDKEIADHLDITVATASTHLKRIRAKLHVTTRTEAVHLARQWGLI